MNALLRKAVCLGAFWLAFATSLNAGFKIASVSQEDAGGTAYSTFYYTGGAPGDINAQIGTLPSPVFEMGTGDWRPNQTNGFRINVNVFDGLIDGSTEPAENLRIASADGLGTLHLDPITGEVWGEVTWTFDLFNPAGDPPHSIHAMLQDFFANGSPAAGDELTNESAKVKMTFARSSDNVLLEGPDGKKTDLRLAGVNFNGGIPTMGVNLRAKVEPNPTPSAFVLMALGMASLGAARLRKRLRGSPAKA